MDRERIKNAARSNPEMAATYSFKLEERLKEAFFEHCSEEGLSTGGVMRELLKQYLNWEE